MLPVETLRDKIKGMIFGQCLGDAVGLCTEFKFKRDGVTAQFPYTEPIRDWPVCDWTDDSDHMILVMQSLISTENKLDVCDFAKRLRAWANGGFPELGDTYGRGIGGIMSTVIGNEEFITNPVAVAQDVWEKSGYTVAPNGSIMRCCPVSALDDWFKTSQELCKVTHADPRCIASCVLYNYVLYELIHSDARSGDAIDKILFKGIEYARPILSDHPDQVRTRGVPAIWDCKDTEMDFSNYIQSGYTKPISSLELDQQGRIGYVFKTLGCAIYSLQVIKYALENSTTLSYKKTILKIANECGDADTNCSVAGAVLGAYLGYSALPPDWVAALPNHQWLHPIVDQYLSLIGLEG